MTQLVIDANVLRDTCYSANGKAREVLTIVRKRSCNVVVCKEIRKEYKSQANHPDCKNQKSLQKWYELMRSKFFKKVKIDKNDINTCFSRLISQRRFGDGKDIIYVKTAEKIRDNDKTLIADERHFQNAHSCITQLGIRRLELDEVVDVLKSKSYINHKKH